MSATACLFGAGTSRKISPPTDGRDQRRNDGLSPFDIIGSERTNLETFAARPDHAPSVQSAIAEKRAADVTRRGDPSAQERRTRGREDRCVVGLDGRKRNRRECDGRWSNRRRHLAAIADIPIGQDESRFLIILLLCNHAIETDRAQTGMSHTGLPYAQSVTAAPQIGTHNVEPEKSKVGVVIDDRNGQYKVSGSLLPPCNARFKPQDANRFGRIGLHI